MAKDKKNPSNNKLLDIFKDAIDSYNQSFNDPERIDEVLGKIKKNDEKISFSRGTLFFIWPYCNASRR